MNEEQSALVEEQMHHALDLMRAEIEALKAQQRHDNELTLHRLKALESQALDHEQRLRSATAGVTEFKVWSGLAAGGSGLMSLAALLRAFWGG